MVLAVMGEKSLWLHLLRLGDVQKAQRLRRCRKPAPSERGEAFDLCLPCKQLLQPGPATGFAPAATAVRGRQGNVRLAHRPGAGHSDQQPKAGNNKPWGKHSGKRHSPSPRGWEEAVRPRRTQKYPGEEESSGPWLRFGVPEPAASGLPHWF